MRQLSIMLLLTTILIFPRNGKSTDCRSELGVHFKPLFSKSPISWAMETTLAGGKMSNLILDRTYNNQMLLLGLDFSSGAHQFYLEGGAKYWYRSDEDSSIGGGTGNSVWKDYPKAEKRHFGMRELFYGFYRTNTKVKIGLQSMRLGNSMLLDERVLGASINQNLGAFDFDVKLGTVSTDFARRGDFCGTRHVYRLLRGGRFNLVSSDPWKTNFVGGLISWNPAYEKPVANNSKETDEFKDDDFSSDEFSDFKEQKRRLIKNISLVLFEEFGSGFHDYKYYFGALVAWSFPASIDLETEIINQYIKNEKALGYRFQLSRDWTWNSGALTSLAMTYLGKYSIDERSRFYSAFSNLFLGEVMRLDVQDLPFWTIAVRHEFALKFKPMIKILYLKQTELDHLNEWDIQLSAHIFKGLRLYGVYSKIESELLDGTTDMTRLEAKWAF